MKDRNNCKAWPALTLALFACCVVSLRLFRQHEKSFIVILFCFGLLWQAMSLLCRKFGARAYPHLLGSLCLILLVIFAFRQFSVVGVSAGYVEEDARASQQIEADWESSRAVGKDLAALLFYDEDRNEHVYSLYVNREGLSFGYFFQSGGEAVSVADGVRGFDFGEKGMAVLSLNRDRVKRIELCAGALPQNGTAKAGTGKGEEAAHGAPAKGIDVDPSRPFAVVLDAALQYDRVRLLDENGGTVPFFEISAEDAMAWRKAEAAFDARVLEVRETYLLVEPLEGEAERKSADRITVPLGGLGEDGRPAVQEGGKVRVAYDGMIQETDPAGLGEVYSITVLP